MTADSTSPERGVVVWERARDLLSTFRPLMWVVLEDLAFDAEWDDSRLVAASSARRVAEHLHIDPSTAVTAIRSLRALGIVELCQTSGVAGRFGLAAYTLHLPPGVEVLPPRTGTPRAETPHTEKPYTDNSHADNSHADPAHVDRARRAARPPRAAVSPRQWSQEVLEFGTVES
jgi:hypothetical protein